MKTKRTGKSASMSATNNATIQTRTVERVARTLDQLAQDIELLKMLGKKSAEDLQLLANWRIDGLRRDHDAIKLELKLLRDDLKPLLQRAEAEAVEPLSPTSP